VFPLALTLSFGARRVWVAALDVSEDGSPWHAADHVTVVFDEHVAQRLELSI
jgi:hypothetical protein